MPVSAHAERVKKELKDAGVTSYGLIKTESRHLYEIIHEDEHIGGVVYGQYDGKGSAMLVATTKRLIFLDRKPLFTTSDELTYDIISGVRHDRAGLTHTVILHTRIGDYTIRYANPKCAGKFVEYLEARRLEGPSSKIPKPETEETAPVATPSFTNESTAFLREHDIAVMSTVDRSGNVQGAVVYYLANQFNQVFILTKSETAKVKNILAHGQVALTIFDATSAQTLNIQGIAEFETDQQMRNYVFKTINTPRVYSSEAQLPPVTKLSEGSFTVIRVTPFAAKYTDYKKLKR